ncbi:MAG: hypothetical protein II983_07805 [Firmicutes bacterium]|nr:hypothetical protein [Bacillota bacterium]
MDTISSLTHGITLSERKNIVISGVKKIDSFDDIKKQLTILIENQNEADSIH